MLTKRKSLKEGKLQAIAPGMLVDQRSLPFQKRRMRIVKPAVNRVRRQVAEVFFIQLPQGCHQRSWFVDDLGRKSVCLVFVAARPPMDQWRNPKRDNSRQQAKQQEGRGDIAGREAKGVIKPLLIGNYRDAVETRQRTKR